ncbi:hypothetical protein J2X66_005805 [Pseudomonas sp. 3296]|jgi:hypothetical protein|uniref:hypothetical protein n=1 Tax=Pseudomonas sp. 3296 TaxID=2817753 RepID=UPI00285CCAB3|nr:hypothetical protein [Pseudomonas sp. 3296]MDR6918900.1 hypothetical protein [Pseudomonas sp. 3296]
MTKSRSANGVKVKFSYNYGEPGFQVLENTTAHDTYKEVSQVEYVAYGTARAPTSNNSVKAPAASASNQQNCIQAWIGAYREEAGAQAEVNSEQLDEWADWCKAGKTL